MIVPAFTWVSTANVVEARGATPVFCDVDLATFNVEPERVAELVTERTVGIIPVHLFGLCADMGPILALARRYNLWVVEDAACALGGWYHGRHAGTLGDAGCFSFHPRKSITTGEGGMLTTGREELDRLSRSLRDHGASRSDLSRHTEKAGFLLSEYKLLGYNYPGYYTTINFIGNAVTILFGYWAGMLLLPFLCYLLTAPGQPWEPLTTYPLWALVSGVFAWTQTFRALEFEPRATQQAQQIAGLVKLARAALLSSDGINRVAEVWKTS